MQEPEYTINTVTVQNTAPGAVTFYAMATGFKFRYDPPTKTIYANWGYNYGGAVLIRQISGNRRRPWSIYMQDNFI